MIHGLPSVCPGSTQRAAFYHSQPPVGVCLFLCHTSHFHHVSTTTMDRGPSDGLGAGLQPLWALWGSVAGTQRRRQTLAHTLKQKHQLRFSSGIRLWIINHDLSQFVSDGVSKSLMTFLCLYLRSWYQRLGLCMNISSHGDVCNFINSNSGLIRGCLTSSRRHLFLPHNQWKQLKLPTVWGTGGWQQSGSLLWSALGNWSAHPLVLGVERSRGEHRLVCWMERFQRHLENKLFSRPHRQKGEEAWMGGIWDEW